MAELKERLEALVHPAARASASEARRHAGFIAGRLSIGVVAMAALPAVLAFDGGLGVASFVVFLGAATMLASAVMVSRTGDLARSAVMSAAATCLMVVGLELSGIAWTGATLVWLLAPLATPVLRRVPQALWPSFLLSLATLLVVAIDRARGIGGVGDTMGMSGLVLGMAAVATALVGALVLARHVLDREQRGRRRFEQRLDEASKALAMMGDLVTIHDPTGSVLSASDTAFDNLGVPAESLLGQRLFERVHVLDRPALLKCLSDAMRGRQLHVAAIRIRSRNADGAAEDAGYAHFDLRAQAARPEDDKGAADRVVAVFRDVTQRVRWNEEREATRRAAEQAVTAKDRFLATVSHELRTPLNAIIGFSEVLGGEGMAHIDEARRREYANIIHKSGNHLLEVVNALLDISKIETGKIEMRAEPFALEGLVRGCDEMMRLRATQHGVGLVTTLEDNLPCLVADRRACRQVLINLVSNAIKFTPRGGTVTVSVRAVGGTVELGVADSGVGIAPSDLPRLGNPFFQASEGHDRRFEGSGLGLSIVRGLVGLLGGSILIESGLGVGTTVVVKLPIEPLQPVGRPGPAPIEVRQRPADAARRPMELKKSA